MLSVSHDFFIRKLKAMTVKSTSIISIGSSTSRYNSSRPSSKIHMFASDEFIITARNLLNIKLIRTELNYRNHAVAASKQSDIRSYLRCPLISKQWDTSCTFHSFIFDTMNNLACTRRRSPLILHDPWSISFHQKESVLKAVFFSIMYPNMVFLCHQDHNYLVC